MSVKLGKSRIEVRDPFDSSSEGNGCDFERSVHEGRDMIRLTVYTQRSCECGAFMIFDHTSNYKLAFSVADRPEPSKIEYYPSFSSAFVPSSMRVPFVGDHTTIIGRTLIVRGRFIADPPQFQIMLLCGGERYEDLKEGHGSVPLVIRINDEDKDTIVIGSQNDKSKPWNEEIRINSKYGSDEFFNIKVRVLWNEMQVIVENVVYQYILHQYHAGPGCIDHISIEGAIVVNEIRLAGGYFPVPYTANFTGGHLAVGEKLHITGLAIGDFEVNLVGENEQDIPFHIKCIFDDVKCVRNSMKDGAWGAEERDGGFPFEKSRYFEMIISIDRPFIEVFAYGWYDGRPHSSFTHRISNPELGYKRLLVKGQVWLAVVEVEKSS
ncbi:galactoside-binding lectin domain-containing protein [Ditylenchus destructor]|uniref:Galectin n=1 Tax=Ditylenchus destructor TaxID=166010 RepID=A0AAD4RD30_9BILA|nr:galactoside-binding lectin domain-containing protein [Ditylenchus destructor]